jgi:hypothetical protein
VLVVLIVKLLIRIVNTKLLQTRCEPLET